MELTSAQASAPTSYVAVAPSSEEYKRVEAKLTRIGCRLVKLEKMENAMQESLYQTLKRALSAEARAEGGSANEQTWFFHGTSSIHAIEGIGRSGFDNRYFSLEGKFGPGIYLADDIAKSHAYTKCVAETDWCRVIFVCKAVLGKMEELSNKKERVTRAGPRPGFQSVHWNGYEKRKVASCKPSQSGFYDEYILYRYGQAVPWLKMTYTENAAADPNFTKREDDEKRMGPTAVLAIVRLMLDALRPFSAQKCDIFRDFLALLRHCDELINSMIDHDVAHSTTLNLLGDELLMGLSLLEKWFAGRAGVLGVLQSKARLSRLADLVASVRTYRDEMMQIVQQEVQEKSLGKNVVQRSDSGLSILSSVRRGVLDDYNCVRNGKARQLWMQSFPGRHEVPWGEFHNSLCRLESMKQTDDLGRNRVFYWLKLELGVSVAQSVSIDQWNTFTTKKVDFDAAFVSWFNVPVPGEDEMDVLGTNSNHAQASEPRPSAPPLSCFVLEDELEVEAQKLGILSAQPSVGVCFVDVAFLVDCTGTMRKYIDVLKSHVAVLTAQVKSTAPGALVRLSFVGYRDIGDEQHITVMPFTTNVQALVEILHRTEASGGGGDAAEDVLRGLEVAGTQLEWSCGSRTVRRLVHLGDAPSHGTRYHKFAERTKSPSWAEAQNKWDRFPNTDANGSHGQALMSLLARKKIDYTFVELAPFTQTMTDQFLDWYNMCQEKVLPMQVVPLLDLNGLADIVAEQIAVTLKHAQYLSLPVHE